LILYPIFFKKINIPSNLKIEIFCFNNFKFLIIGNQDKKIYFLIPKNLKIFFFNNFLFFHLNVFKNVVNKLYKYNNFFFTKIFNKILYLQKYLAKTIFIRGVGLRINFLEDSLNKLKLKLGFSHFIYLNYSKELIISIFKKKILIRSYNNILLGNFCMFLKKYRPINVFTGKGLHIKRSKFKLKQYTKKI
jgi:ribosomal protein L6P/L9E